MDTSLEREVSFIGCVRTKIVGIYLFIYLFIVGFLCVTALAVLELALVDQAGLELTEIHLSLPPKCWD